VSGNPDDIVVGIKDAPEIFVDGFRGVLTNGQIVKLNFFQNRFDSESQEPTKVAAFTLVISMNDFIAVSQTLPTLVAEFQEKGIVSVVTSQGDESA